MLVYSILQPSPYGAPLAWPSFGGCLARDLSSAADPHSLLDIPVTQLPFVRLGRPWAAALLNIMNAHCKLEGFKHVCSSRVARRSRCRMSARRPASGTAQSRAAVLRARVSWLLCADGATWGESTHQMRHYTLCPQAAVVI